MLWISETSPAPPRDLQDADERLSVREFLAAASENRGYRWVSDYHRGKDLLAAIDRRLREKSPRPRTNESTRDFFHRHRQFQGQRARVLGRFVVRIESDLTLALPRAPSVSDALVAALESRPSEPFLMSLRELLGIIGAWEWRKKGIEVAGLREKLIPHYGVFSPVRSEYLDLVTRAPLATQFKSAIDVGTGSGVLALILASRGIARVIATDAEKRALTCARDNVERQGLSTQIEIREADLFPEEKADLIVCNPPWLPLKATSRLERAVYDPDHQMLRGFLTKVGAQLNPGGEAWLILSNLAELIGLRGPTELEDWIAASKLRVLERLEAPPRHPKAQDREDPLFEARSREVTSLWRLAPIEK